MMFHKIFRRSFNRSSKDDASNTVRDTTAATTPTTKKTPKFFTSKSFDASPRRSSSPKESNGTTPIKKAPLAGKEESPDIDNSKKVVFRENSKSSETGVIDDIDHHETLFDDGVLKAFEVGNLSIAEFLESPHTSAETTPTSTLIKKEKNDCNGQAPTPQHIAAKSSSDTASSPVNREPVSPMKKPSLLDQAHAKGGGVTARLPSSPALRKQVKIRTESVESTDEKVKSKSKNPELQSQPVKENERSKHRFSKSLEHLAQQVFGEEFQQHLEDASKQSSKVPIIQPDIEYRRSKTLSPRSPSKTSETSTKHCPKSEPINRRYIKKVAKPSQNNKSGLQRRHSASKESDVVSNQLIMSTRSVDIPCSYSKQIENDILESWGNKLDLSSTRHSIISSDAVASRLRMLPVIEGQVLKSPSRQQNIDYDVTDSCTTKERCRAKSVGSVGNSSMEVCRFQQIHADRQKLKLKKSDSEAANYGSASEKDLSASETSVLEIQFPPPPPLEDCLKTETEEVCKERIVLPEEAVPFDWEVLSDDLFHDSSSVEYSVGSESQHDALVESLMSIVPMPENPDEFQPALTNALGEIVSEIVSSRRKLTRILKAIEIHQHILKDQNKKIESQAQEIATLRLMALGLHSSGGLPPTTVKLRTAHRTVQRPQSARTNRQSREMIELNYTLDKLIYQCSSLCSSPRDDLKNTIKPAEQSTGVSVRRSNTFPSRERVQLKHLMKIE